MGFDLARRFTAAPWFMPFCASCRYPVEQYTVHPMTQEDVVDFEATCHGKTEGRRLTERDFQAMWKEGTPIVLFKGTLRQLVNAVVNNK